MSKLDVLLNRLPALFDKEETSNNYKILSLIAKQGDELQELHGIIKKFWNVDTSEGYGLDRLGKDEGIKRGRYDDEMYRKMIKIQYVVNLSDGDLETMSLILKAYMEEGFGGIEEGWDSDFGEPASFLVHLNDGADYFPSDLIKRIKPAGVGYYLLFDAIKGNIEISATFKRWKFPYPICGIAKCAPILGKNNQAYLTINPNSINVNLPYPITNRKEMDKRLGKETKNSSQIVVKNVSMSLPMQICGRTKVGV